MCRDLPTLTVAYSTHGARALGLRAEEWPLEDGVDRLVLVQEAEADPRIDAHLAGLARRADVRVVRLETTGLSRSRNAALDHAEGDVVLIADDDVTHPAQAYAVLRAAFAADPDLALAAGRSLRPGGVPRKPGTGRQRVMTRFNSGRLSSHEMAIRLDPVRAARVRFDPDFGVGAGTPAFLGEEYIFASDCLKAGLKGAHLPVDVSVHPLESSGFVWTGRAAAQARAEVIGRVFGPWAPLARLAFAAKNLRRFGGPGDLGAFLLPGRSFR